MVRETGEDLPGQSHSDVHPARFVFEIGGKGKGFTLVKDFRQAWLALDDIETGIGRKIPLWLFGFLY